MTVVALLGAPALGALSPSTQGRSLVAKPVDVALTVEGLLVGLAVDPQGRPLPGVRVALEDTHGRRVGAVADHRGAFAYRLSSGGVYRVRMGRTVVLCRAWAAGVAPPAAATRLRLVAPSPLVRGQQPSPAPVGAPVGPGAAPAGAGISPLAVTGLAVAAVAVPVTLAADDPPGS